MNRIFLFLLMLTFFADPIKSQPLQTVEFVDPEKYCGKWYEIASYPTRFQKGCRCTTAEYEFITSGGYFRVINRCIRFKSGKSKISSIKGKAFVVKNSGNAKLKVRFFWPFLGDYYITALAEDYSWAVVGHPKRNYLWILSRESFMPTDTYIDILRIVSARGYDPKLLQKTPQNCDGE